MLNLCYHPYLVFLLFAVLLSLHLKFLIVYITCFSTQVLLEKSANSYIICHRTVSCMYLLVLVVI